MEIKWYSYSEHRPIECEDVLAYNEAWKDEYNPTGIRIGFLGAHGFFFSSYWDESEQQYVTSQASPTKFMPLSKLQPED